MVNPFMSADPRVKKKKDAYDVLGVKKKPSIVDILKAAPPVMQPLTGQEKKTVNVNNTLPSSNSVQIKIGDRKVNLNKAQYNEYLKASNRLARGGAGIGFEGTPVGDALALDKAFQEAQLNPITPEQLAKSKQIGQYDPINSNELNLTQPLDFGEAFATGLGAGGVGAGIGAAAAGVGAPIGAGVGFIGGFIGSLAKQEREDIRSDLTDFTENKRSMGVAVDLANAGQPEQAIKVFNDNLRQMKVSRMRLKRRIDNELRNRLGDPQQEYIKVNTFLEEGQYQLLKRELEMAILQPNPANANKYAQQIALFESTTNDGMQ